MYFVLYEIFEIKQFQIAGNLIVLVFDTWASLLSQASVMHNKSL